MAKLKLTKKMVDLQMKAFQRGHAEGLLTPEQIRGLEEVPGWTWGTPSPRQTNEAFITINDDEHGTLCSVFSKADYQREGVEATPLYQSFDDSYQDSDVIDDALLEKEQELAVREALDWCRMNGFTAVRWDEDNKVDWMKQNVFLFGVGSDEFTITAI